MPEWLRNFDRLSFWLGFLAASLFWFLVSRMRPALAAWRESAGERADEKRAERTQSDEVRLANDLQRLVQRVHLGEALFSLDEVLVAPRLLAPQPPPAAYETPPSEDVTDSVLPSTPDWPELASYYGAPWLAPAEALKGGANLAIIGQPGSGKTVALAALAIQIIQKAPEAGSAARLSPVWVHAADLLGAGTEGDPMERLIAIVAPSLPSIKTRRLPVFLRSLLQQERLLLLVDGLDELPTAQLDEAIGFMEALMKARPRLRVAATAHPERLGRLPALGFQILPVSAWGPAQRAVLITRWTDLWNRYLVKDQTGKGQAADPLLIIGWLLNNTLNLTPLETTLKIWAALAGDALGPSPAAAIEAYLQRMQAGQPGKNRAALEQLAAQMVLDEQTVLPQDVAEKWLGGSEIQDTQATDAAPENVETAGERERGKAAKRSEAAKRVRARGALPDLIDCGLLTQHFGGRLRLRHPLLTAYLAAQKLTPLRGGNQIAAQAEWSGRGATLNYMALIDPQASWLGAFLKEDEEDFLQRSLLQIGRWLRTAPEGLAWVSPAMRRLTSLVTRDQAPFTLRLRALTALTLSGNSGLPVMLRQLSTSPNPELRQLAALGMGMIRDPKSLADLLRLVNERIPQIYRAAILALTTQGESQGLEAVAGLLLSGDASQSRAAAESLANHFEEGHPTLEEASRMEDPGVRRAAAFGLGRVHQPWATQILEKLRAEDPQWVVQDAAIQALQALEDENPRLPRPLPPPTQLAWLNAFAAERGMGVAPGKPAAELMYRSLAEGTDEQALAAIHYLKSRGDESSLTPLLQVYQIKSGELRAAAFEALHRLTARGYSLPALTQIGFRA